MIVISGKKRPFWWVGALIFILVWASSCAHTQTLSGKYIQWRESDSLEKVALEFDVPVWRIVQANKRRGRGRGRGRKFVPGQWYFIPQPIGIAPHLFQGAQGGRFVDGRASTKALLEGEDFLWPVPSARKVSSLYGIRWNKFHEGIDIPASLGVHILAVADGRVVFSGPMGGYGHTTVIEHDFSLFSVYAHALKNHTRRGQRVSRGQVIAQVGSSGRSTGPHLHFEIRRQGRPLNPLLAFLASKVADGTN